MNFVMNFWWLWLVLALACFLYGGFNQIRRIKKMMNGNANSFGDGIYCLFITGSLYFIFGVLLIVSIVLNAIHYASH